MAYTKYSLTPANNNAAPPDGAPEGMLPSAVNDTMRDMMAQIRDVGDGIRGGTYTMTAPVITGGSITGVALSGNTFTNPVITGGSINNTPIGATTANTGKFTTLTNAALTSGRVTYAGTSGVLQDDADFTFNGTTVTMANDASISGLTVGKGGGSVSFNTAIGSNALAATATGNRNTGVGAYSLNANTSGASNTGLGISSLLVNTSGSNNVAVGDQALAANTTGANNTALGTLALIANTTASNNTAVGYQAGYSNTTGGEGTFLGYQAGYSTTTANSNTFLGIYSGYYNTTGANNTGVGTRALGAGTANLTGSNNTAVGLQSLYSNTTASNNTAVGYQASYTGTTATQCVAIGTQALYTNNGSDNTAVGYGVLVNNTSGVRNTAVGGAQTGVGFSTMYANTTGSDNSAFGNQALYSNTTGSNNVAIGRQALVLNTTASNNTAVGYQALYNNTSPDNTAIGYQAGYSQTNSTYGANLFAGRVAGKNVSTGWGNTLVGGYSAGELITTGSRNTVLGCYDGNQGGLDIRTASKYIVLSDGDGNPRAYWDSNGRFQFDANNASSVIGDFNNNTATSPYGIRMTFGSAAPNNTTSYFQRFGDSSAYRFYVYSNGTVSNSTGTYNTISDAKLKENIVDATPKLDDLMKVKVRNYNLIGDELKQIGFVAQELEQVFPALIDNCPDLDADNNDLGTVTKNVKSSIFIPILVKAIQELKAEVDSLKAQLNNGA